MEHFHQPKGLPRSADGGNPQAQQRVGTKVGGPHQRGVEQHTSKIDAAQILEGVDEATAKNQAVQLERLVKNAAQRQAEPLEQVPQRHHQCQRRRQQQREQKVKPRRVPHRRAAQPRQAEGAKEQRHHPDIQKAVHDDGGQRKPGSVLHPAAGIDGAEQVPHMEGQQKIDGVAPRHAPQQVPADGTLMNTDELFPAQQTEHMPQQHQRHRGQQKDQRCSQSLQRCHPHIRRSKAALCCSCSASAYSAGVPKGRCRSVANPRRSAPCPASTL